MRIGLNLMYVGAGLAGGRVYAEGLLRGLAEVGGDDEFVLFTRKDTVLPDLPPTRFTLHRSSVPASSNFRRTFWEYLVLPGKAKGYSLQAFHGLGGLSPSVKGVPLLLTIHDLIYHHFPESVPIGARKFMEWMLPRSARRAERIIVDSHATARDVMEFLHVPESRLRVIHLGPGNAPGSVENRDLTRIQVENFSIDGPFILSVGRAYPHKNLEGLARAFVRLAQGRNVKLQWVHVGDVLDSGGRLDRLTRELGIAERVRFLGFLDDRSLHAVYAAATVVAFPSLLEGFGLPILEAMAWGIPVVAANTGSLPEVVGDAGILADTRDPAAFAGALASVLHDEQLRRSLREKGFLQVARFSWKKCAAQTLDVYREIC